MPRNRNHKRRQVPRSSSSPSSSEGCSSEDRSLFDDASQGSSSAAPSSTSEASVSYYSEEHLEISNLHFVGPFWHPLKPRHETSLYYKIFLNAKDMQVTIENLITAFYQDKQGIICQILQLFVDLCGAQNVKVNSIYDYPRKNFSQAVVSLSEALQENDDKFVFRKQSKVCDKALLVYKTFLCSLMQWAYNRDVLFDVEFVKHIVGFINSMSHSLSVQIRGVGIITGIFMLTATLRRCHELSLCSEMDVKEREAIRDRILRQYLQWFREIYNRNCLVYDSRLVVAKVVSAREVAEWINGFPDLFLKKDNCFRNLAKFQIVDEDSHVRMAVLCTLEKIVQEEHNVPYLANRIGSCFEEVSRRLNDTNFGVAIKAVQVFIKSINLYSSQISAIQRQRIFQMMYQKHEGLAKEAGSFAVRLVESISTDEKFVLVHVCLCAFSSKENKDKLPLFVQSCLESASLLEDPGIIVETLLDKTYSLKDRALVIRVINEYLRYKLTGRYSSLYRDEEVERPLYKKPETHALVAQRFLPKFTELLAEFETDDKSVVLLLQVVGWIDFGHYREVNETVLDMLVATVKIGILKEIIEGACQILRSIFDGETHNVAREKTNRICRFFARQVNEALDNLSTKSTPEFLTNLRLILLKTSILFSKFDMTDVLNWPDLPKIFSKTVNLQAIQYIIPCLKSYLIWTFHKHGNPTLDGDNCDNSLFLNNNFSTFIYYCFEIFPSEPFFILDNLNDLYVNIHEESQMKVEENLPNLLTFPDEAAFKDNLNDFILNFIISGKHDLFKRHECLRKFVELIYLGVLNDEFYATIFRFYASHYDQFGRLMDHMLANLSRHHPGVAVMVTHTLRTVYDEVLKVKGGFNRNSEEGRMMKNLAYKLSMAKEVKNTFTLIKIIDFTTNVALSSTVRQPLLYYVRYFAVKLDADSRMDVYESFKNKLSQRHYKSDSVLLFLTYLKDGNK